MIHVAGLIDVLIKAFHVQLPPQTMRGRQFESSVLENKGIDRHVLAFGDGIYAMIRKFDMQIAARIMAVAVG